MRDDEIIDHAKKCASDRAAERNELRLAEGDLVELRELRVNLMQKRLKQLEDDVEMLKRKIREILK